MVRGKISILDDFSVSLLMHESKWLKWWKLLQPLGDEDSLPLLIGSGDVQTDHNKKKSEGSMVWMGLLSIAGKTDEKLMSVEEGDLRSAQGVFDTMAERTIVSWSVMIAGYGMHGQINAAISLFTQMVETGMQPNEITFMNILSACSHAGAVEKGRSYFRSMRDFGIEPNAEHFACIVDLLSRAGDLKGAYEIIKSMPSPVDVGIWGALLNGCRIHQRMDIIKSIERDLLDVSTEDTGYYTLYSKVYAEGGNWDEFGNVRTMMKGIGLRKVPGYSIIELDQQVYRFGAGDTPHPQMKDMYSFLENFQSLTREQGIT